MFPLQIYYYFLNRQIIPCDFSSPPYGGGVGGEALKERAGGISLLGFCSGSTPQLLLFFT